MQHPNRSIALWGLVCTLGVILGLSPASGAQNDSNLPAYVRAKSEAIVRNFQDRQGLEVTKVPAGTLFQVHSVSQGAYPFYEVSSAGGFPVWVFGEYLEKTDVDGVLRVNADHINQRPRPSTEVGSMALRTRLMSNDRVLLIRRQDEGKTWNQDWIQVWSPERTHAWVEASATEAVTDVAGAAAEWKAGLRVIPKAKAADSAALKPATVPASTQKTIEVRPEATKSLHYSDRLFEQAIADKNVTLAQLTEVEAAYHRVLEMAPAGTSVREMALQQLEKLKMHKSMAELREQLRQDESNKVARLEALAKLQQAEELKRTASWGRFHARGWVETETIEGAARYFVRWEGERQTELTCGSGRYDLSNFVGYQVGVQGSTRRVAAPATLETPEELRLLDISRIEVIAGSTVLR